MSRFIPFLALSLVVCPLVSETPQKASAAVRLKALEQEAAKLRREILLRTQHEGAEGASPAAALEALKEGNERFVKGLRIRSQLGAGDPATREALAKGQAPFAVIVTCSDSRLADNFIFDQELGRLFTIREAGNCPDLQGLASVEYAVEHLGSVLVVVLGHESCGAVKAVFESGPKPLPGNLWSLQAAMAGLLESVHRDTEEPLSLHLSHLAESNARRQAEGIVARSAIVKELCAKGKITVLPAMYDLASGKVRFLPAIPAGEAPAGEEKHH